MLSKLKTLDAYPKVNEDFFTRTYSGGVITVVSSLIMLCLFISELSKQPAPCIVCDSYSCADQLMALCIAPTGLWLRMNTISELSVDTSRGEMMDIYVC